MRTFQQIEREVREGVHAAHLSGAEVKGIYLGHEEFVTLQQEAQPHLMRYCSEQDKVGRTYWRNLRIFEVREPSHLDVQWDYKR